MRVLLPFLAIIAFITIITPESFWNTQAASGGDTGSHYYALWVLFHQSLPVGKISAWNPGALFGEFQLLHYFPAPFLFMSLLGIVMPLGLAFNLGTIAGLYLLPIAVYYAFLQRTKSALISWFAAIGSLTFVFNESYSMWGGNALSTLAGQFAHLYALVFAVLFLGLSWKQLTTEAKLNWRLTLFSGAVLGLVGLSHSYVYLLMPFLMLGLWIEDRFSKKSFFYLLQTGLISLITCSWFLIDQVKHAKWMTANPMTWGYDNFWDEVVPKIFWPILILAFLSLAVITAAHFLFRTSFKQILKTNQLKHLPLVSFLVCFAGCTIMYVLFPKFGLVNARIWPQVHLFGLCLSGAIVGLFYQSLSSVFSDKARRLGIIALTGLSGWWIIHVQYHYPYWIDWNYTSWSSKKNWPYAQEVFDFLKADFSKPRATYEHHPSLNEFGSTRVFELLPLFSKRATLESLYQEAMFTAPLTYWVQASVSTNPSCPIRGWNCPQMNFEQLKNKTKLLGVQFIILKSSAPKAAIRKTKGYHLAFGNDFFEVWQTDQASPLVEVIRANKHNASLIKIQNWSFREDFYPWFEDYQPGNPYLIVAPENTNFKLADETKSCEESVFVDYNFIHLQTKCPGKVHLLKFTYHPKLKASDFSPIYPISPGFMAIVPNSESTVISPAAWD